MHKLTEINTNEFSDGDWIHYISNMNHDFDHWRGNGWEYTFLNDDDFDPIRYKIQVARVLEDLYMLKDDLEAMIHVDDPDYLTKKAKSNKNEIEKFKKLCDEIL